MTPRQIEVLHAILMSPTLTEAAHILGVSQPAVSATLGQIESELKMPLFERRGGRLIPRPELEALEPEVSRVFEQLQRVHRVTKNIREGRSGSLSVVGNQTLTVALMADAVSELRARHPDVHVKIDSAYAQEALKSVARREFDLGLIYGPRRDVGTGTEVIGQTAIACGMRANHPLAELDEIRPGDLDKHPIITFAVGTPIRSQLDDAFHKEGARLNAVAEVGFSLTAGFLAKTGNCVALIDPLIARTGAFPNLAIRPFRPQRVVEIQLLYPNNRPRSSLSVELGEILRRLVREASRLPPISGGGPVNGNT